MRISLPNHGRCAFAPARLESFRFYKAVSAPVELKKIELAAPEPARWIETGPLGLGPGARHLRTPFAQRRCWR